MGYNIYITRRTNHLDSGASISREEWIAYIKNDPELTADSETYSGLICPAFWKGSTAYGETWLDLDNGCIYTKNPDNATLGKMLEVANRLNAKVQGDDGEVYVSPDLEKGFIREDVAAPSEKPREKSWWNKLFNK